MDERPGCVAGANGWSYRRGKPRHNRLCWLMQKRTEERSCIWRLKARETEHMSPVKLTPIVFEIGRRELTNEVIISVTPVENLADLIGPG